jgi:hypothetical protein
MAHDVHCLWNFPAAASYSQIDSAFLMDSFLIFHSIKERLLSVIAAFVSEN